MTTKQRQSAKKSSPATAKTKRSTSKGSTSRSRTKTSQTTKRSNKKTTSRVQNQGKKLVVAKGADCFWVHNGPILKNLLELEQALDAMSEHMFAHHVGRGRNDFAEWVEHTLKDAAAATDLRKARKPHTARTAIVRHLKFYNLPR